MIIIVDICLNVSVEKQLWDATMNKTTALGEQFGMSDFLCGCWDE